MDINEIKYLANGITCIAFRDALEDLHAQGIINHDTLGQVMRDAKNTTAFLLLAISEKVLKERGERKQRSKQLKSHVCDLYLARFKTEWEDHGKVDGEWHELEEILAKLSSSE